MPKSPMSRRQLLFSGGAAALALASAAGWYAWRIAPAYDGGALSVAEARAQAEAGEILLIDIRRPDEWHATGVGAGAHPIDMRRPDFAEELARIAGPGGQDRPIALICARGVRSARLARRLTEAGWSRIIDVPEGMLGSSAGPGWLGAGLAVAAPKQGADG